MTRIAKLRKDIERLVYKSDNALFDSVMATLNDLDAKERKRVVAELRKIFLSRPSSVRDYYVVARLVNELLPDSEFFIKKYVLGDVRHLARKVRMRLYETRFSLFVMWSDLDDVPRRVPLRKYRQFCFSQLSSCLCHLKYDICHTGWMAAHGLGEHWPNVREAEHALCHVLATCRFAAGRQLAICPGIEDLLQRDSLPSDSHARLRTVLERVSTRDRSEKVRWAAEWALARTEKNRK